jgi:malonyl-CoA O-methyltransferase
MNYRADKQLVGRRFRRALHTYNRSAQVQGSMAASLLALVARAGGLPGYLDRVLEFGCGSALLTAMLFERCSVGAFFANDLVAECRPFVEAALPDRSVERMEFLAGDIEQIDPLPHDLDLVVSNATGQWLHEPTLFFERLAASVRPGGVVLFSTFGTENMREIALLGAASLSYRTLDEIAAFSGSQFEVVSIEQDIRRQEFESPEALLRHIRETGVNGVSKRAWSRAQYREFLQRYRSGYATGSGVYLTWHPVYCCFRRKR